MTTPLISLTRFALRAGAMAALLTLAGCYYEPLPPPVVAAPVYYGPGYAYGGYPYYPAYYGGYGYGFGYGRGYYGGGYGGGYRGGGGYGRR